MYNTKIVCTYHTPDVFTSSDTINEEEREFIRDTIYRQELLNILNMDEFNDTEMNKAIHELYEKLKSCKELKECMAKIVGRFLSEDLELGLMIMFSYDYMYLTHVCITEYLESTFSKVEPNASEVSKELNSQNIKALIQLINS